MSRNPITAQRSPWMEAILPPFIHEAFARVNLSPRYCERNVHDGVLSAIICEEPPGWHLSISHVRHNGTLGRYPSWDEIAHARYELLPTDVDFVMHLPPLDEFVSVHETTFHLWESPESGDDEASRDHQA